MKLYRKFDPSTNNYALTFTFDARELAEARLAEEFAGIWRDKPSIMQHALFVTKVLKTREIMEEMRRNPYMNGPYQGMQDDLNQAFRDRGMPPQYSGTFQSAYDRARRILNDDMPPPRIPDPPWCAILGLPKTATKAEIKSKYRELAKLHHPDAGGSQAKFNEISRAYQEAIR